jgi:UDP-N-acetylmuramoyl-L-alanyl-D-glutamate--2,6-diaminopimelate ligase
LPKWKQVLPNDIILIAGKGHETYQEIEGVRHDFDDMAIVKEILEQLNK